jgi:hypothetical protein
MHRAFRQRRSWRTLGLLPTAFVLVLLFGSSAVARRPVQDAHCDAALRTSGADPYGYRLRGDRCEGEYIRAVAGTRLRVVSFTESVEDFNAADGRPLVIEWSAPENAIVHVRAHALRHRLYYQMDTIRQPGERVYSWPPNLLSTFQLKRTELGIVGWMSSRIGSADHDVFVPLRVRQSAAVSRSTRYKVVLLPDVELIEVFLTLAQLAPDGRATAYVMKDQPLRYGNYAAEQGIEVLLPSLIAPGVYRLEVGATLRAGGSSTTQLWLYHAGN